MPIVHLEPATWQRRLEALPSVIAPDELDPGYQQSILRLLCELTRPLPDEVWNIFPELEDALDTIFQTEDAEDLPSSPAGEILALISHSKCLGKLQFAATICTPTTGLPPEQQSLFLFYQGMVIIACMHLQILGQHEVAIENALREIRLLATRSSHSQLLAFLPDPFINGALSVGFSTLLEQLDAKRRSGLPAICERGMSYIFVALNDAKRNARGIIRRRDASYQPQRPQRLSLESLPSMDESPMEIYELVCKDEPDPGTPASPETADEPNHLNARRTFRVELHDDNLKSPAQQAIQAKRVAEQYVVRELSLPCCYEQLTDWDIRQLLRRIVMVLTTADTERQSVAATLLCMLLCGRKPESLARFETTLNGRGECLSSRDDHVFLAFEHRVPGSNQPEQLNDLLPPVGDHVVLLLPDYLSGWYQNGAIWCTEYQEMQTFLREINETHICRLSKGRISRYLEHWYMNNDLEPVEIALVRGIRSKKDPRLAYTRFSLDRVVSNHILFTETLFKLAGYPAKLPQQKAVNKALGTRLTLPPDVLRNLFKLKRKKLHWPDHDHSLSNLRDFHNYYVAYVWLLLSFATGHRPVNAPFGLLTDFNPHNATWWISDKERRHGLAARTLVLPDTAVKQVLYYQQHLEAIHLRTRFLAPSVNRHCQDIFAGIANLLFLIGENRSGEPSAIEVRPSLLRTLLGEDLPLALNWTRHHMRSTLNKYHSWVMEVLDCWMGHEEIGQEGFGRFSGLSLDDYRRIASVIEQIIKQHKIEAVAGCPIP